MFAFSAPAILVTAIFLLNPLGIQDAAEQQYQDNINAFLSPFYPKAGSVVSVVLLDENFVKKRDGYPLSFTTLRNLHKTLASFAPESVFYDFLIHEEHSKNLDRLTKEYQRQNFPVVLSSNSHYDTQVFTEPIRFPAKFPIRNTLFESTYAILERQQLSDYASPFGSVVWSGYGDYYPLVLEEHVSQSNENHVPNLSQSPAWSLFSIHCHLNQKLHSNSTHSLCQSTTKPDDIPAPMLIRWSHSYPDDASERQPLERALEIGKLLVLQGLYSEPEFDKLFRVTTPPIEYIKASDLYSTRLSQSQLEAKLSHRIVLVGYFLGNGLDIAATPLHGSLPGVFRHAMALDNLIQLDNRYWHMPIEDVVFGLDINDLIELLVNVGCIIIVLYVREKQLKFSTVKEWVVALNRMQAENTEQIVSDTQYCRFLKQQHKYLELKRKDNLRYMPMFVVPLVLMGISIFISESIYAFGIANWYTLPLIFLFSIPAFMSILINDLRLRMVVRQLAHQSDRFGLQASFIHFVCRLTNKATSARLKRNQP
ncbi:CHASE2 domain-containing protein [Vibrio ulleungensis]|uniref:CHASE2 domain-containing protein n=1 Tax=Vibrio ulleungensis TaxID=2807619 RepID=UPI002E28730C|nr:CHASE2 domain-containing protein [Vibrio ulleungensis]